MRMRRRLTTAIVRAVPAENDLHQDLTIRIAFGTGLRAHPDQWEVLRDFLGRVR